MFVVLDQDSQGRWENNWSNVEDDSPLTFPSRDEAIAWVVDDTDSGCPYMIVPVGSPYDFWCGKDGKPSTKEFSE